MTAQTTAEALPLRPAGKAGRETDAQYAPTRAREAPRAPRARRAAGILAGASVIDRPPPAITAVWAKHAASARFYDSPAALVTWLVRWPRYAFGAWHAFVEVPVLYFLAWSGDSVPKRIGVLAFAAITLRLLGIHLFWSWL